MSRRIEQLWINPPSDVPNIARRLQDAFQQFIDLILLLRYIVPSGILSDGQLDRLQDTSHFCESNVTKITHLLQYIVPHGEKGLRILLNSLKSSGESAPHPGHTYLAKRLEWELSATPEEKANEKHQQMRMRRMSTSLLMSVKQDLREQGESVVEELKLYVLMNDREGEKFKREVKDAQNTDEVLDALTVHNVISHSQTTVLVDIARQFCRQTSLNEACHFEMVSGLEELQANIISELEDSVPLYQLMFCVMCTPLLCGASDYYRSITHLSNSASVIRRVYLDCDPRVFVRVVLQFSNYSPTRQRVMEYSKAVESSSPSNPANTEVIELQEEYASILVELVRKCDRQTVTIILNSTNCGLLPSHENSSHLPVLPYINYLQPKVLINALQIHEHREQVKEALKKLRNYNDSWSAFSRSTRIATVSDTLLNEYPINFPQEELVIVTLHLSGDEWRDPVISQLADLAESIASAYEMSHGSVMPYRPILTNSETDAKGHCKVELVVSTKVACIMIRAALDKKAFFIKESISYVEFKAAGKYHLMHPVSVLDLLQRQAFENTHLQRHFQELHSAILPRTLHQPTRLSIRQPIRPTVVYVYVLVPLAVAVYYMCIGYIIYIYMCVQEYL